MSRDEFLKNTREVTAVDVINKFNSEAKKAKLNNMTVLESINNLNKLSNADPKLVNYFLLKDLKVLAEFVKEHCGELQEFLKTDYLVEPEPPD